MTALPVSAGDVLPTVDQVWQVFQTPQDSCRTKVWWFHGETETTREGITADLEAFKKAGVGGGRHYCLNRNNTLWAGSKGFWDYQARCATMMRQGRPVVDVMVNGREAGIVWCSPWTLDISRYVKKGMNQLVLKVSNVLSNRMIGDAGLSEHERVTFAQPQIYQPGDALMPSGLFGDAVSVLIY